MPEPKQILFLHPYWQIGGVEQTNLRWIEILAQKGIVSDVATCGFSGHDLPYVRSIKSFSGKLSLYMRFLFQARHYDALIICQAYYLPWILLQLLVVKLSSNTRLVLTERNSFFQYRAKRYRGRTIRGIFRFFPWLFDSVIVNATELAAEPEFSAFEGKIHVVHNPRFTDKDFENVAQERGAFGKHRIGTYCRWSAQKNPEFMVRAADVFRRQGMDYSVYCGETDYPFQGPKVANAFEEMRRSPQAIFFCSVFEGYPNLILEARALGLPVIYSVCPSGVREILAGYDNAFEFVPDSVESLESAVKRYKSSAALSAVDGDLMTYHSVRNPELVRRLEMAIGI